MAREGGDSMYVIVDKIDPKSVLGPFPAIKGKGGAEAFLKKNGFVPHVVPGVQTPREWYSPCLRYSVAERLGLPATTGVFVIIIRVRMPR